MHYPGGSSGGGLGGSLGATDNAILRADGTGGATAQGSSVTISDTGVIVTGDGSAAAPIIQLGSVAGNGLFGDSSRLAAIAGNQGDAVFRVGTTGEGTGGVGLYISNNQVIELNLGGFTQAANRPINWSNSNTAVSTKDTGLSRAAAGIVKITNGSTGAGLLQFEETTDPTAPAANNAILYAKDNGAGKTQIVARFPTGAIQVLATEP